MSKHNEKAGEDIFPKKESVGQWGMHDIKDPKHPFNYKNDYSETKVEIRFSEPAAINTVVHQPRAKEGTLLWRQLNSKAFNDQVGGSHYKKLAIQPTEYSMANGLDAAQSNVVKYITRFRDKGGAKDLRKIVHYIEYLLETEYPGE